MRPIDSDALSKTIKETCLLAKPWDYTLIEQVIAYAPTIDPVKHGKWIDREKYRTTKDGVFHTYRFKVCSECGRGSGRKMNRPTPFCPNCGARMDGE